VSDPVAVALREEHAELAALLGGLDDDDWQLESRCAGWSLSDVVLHLCQTDEAALASLVGDDASTREGLPRDQHVADVDELVDVMVNSQRGQAPSELLRRWSEAARRLDEAVDAGDLRRRVTWVAGQLSARTLAATRIAETWIHHGDIASALGVEQRPTDRLWHVARLAWRMLPYAFARADRQLHGPVAFELTSPSGGQWSFTPDEEAATTIRGPALDVCLVAARRVSPEATSLTAVGVDAAAVLELMRTYA
jgi:uncharacterized protein (TIGR03084 family)